VANPSDITKYLRTAEVPNYESGTITDPWDAISQQGKISSYDLSLSGRTNFTNYYLSASFAVERGVIFNDNQKRISLRANVENKVTNTLTIGLNTIYTRRDLSGLNADPSTAYSASPFGTWFYEDGEPTFNYVDGDAVHTNTMRDALLTKNEEISNNLFANFYVKVDAPFVECLSYRFNYSPNYRWESNYNFVRQDTRLPATNNTSASKFNRQDFDWVLENIVTYKRQINNNHAFDATLLYGRNHFGWESTTAISQQLSTGAIGWNNLSIGQILTNSSNAIASDGISSMLRLNYRLKNRYLLTITARRDGSSVFAANNKYATFPSAAFAWVVSDEPFLKGIPSINNLKLRVSYGAVGNQAINPYQSLALEGTTRYVFGDGGVSSLGSFSLNMANPDLKWETTYTANAALDFELFKGRLGGTVELYNMDTKDLLVSRSLPNISGYPSILTNLGATNNKGIEITLNTINYQQGKFEWNSSLAFSNNKNKIVHLYRSDTNGDGIEDNDLGNRWVIGQPISIAYDYVFDGVYQEGDQLPTGFKPGYVRLKDLNGDGKIDASNDRTVIGQTGQPNYRWGITNTIKYGNLSLSVFVNAMQGWISSFNHMISFNNGPLRALNMLDTEWWTAENKSNVRPSLAYDNPYGHGYYISRNFVRLQDISMTYEIPKSIVERAKISHFRIFISGKNLFTFTKWPGADPEIGSKIELGLQQSSYPIARMITVGANLSF
jgi:TonB-linked SusC/RagA family outer membrane protein